MSAVGLNSTHGIHGHNHHKTTVDPMYNKNKNKLRLPYLNNNNYMLTSLSDVPQIEQHLHSIHCQRYFPTEIIILAVNCKHVGWPIKMDNVFSYNVFSYKV